MDSERWRLIARVYETVAEWAPEERASVLAAASGNDEELRREVESLLLHDSAPVLIDRPMLEAAAAVLGSETATLTAGTQLGPYRIDRFVGAGGMGRCTAAPTRASTARWRSRCSSRPLRPMRIRVHASTARARRLRALRTLTFARCTMSVIRMVPISWRWNISRAKRSRHGSKRDRWLSTTL